MNIPDPAFLRRAIEIKTELERLEQELHELVKKSSAPDTASPSKKAKSKKSVAASVSPDREAIKPAAQEEPHQEPLLLVDDSGEEQLAVIPTEAHENVNSHDASESCTFSNGFEAAESSPTAPEGV